jgi:hypothetical protein
LTTRHRQLCPRACAAASLSGCPRSVRVSKLRAARRLGFDSPVGRVSLLGHQIGWLGRVTVTLADLEWPPHPERISNTRQIQRRLARSTNQVSQGVVCGAELPPAPDSHTLDTQAAV